MAGPRGAREVGSGLRVHDTVLWHIRQGGKPFQKRAQPSRLRDDAGMEHLPLPLSPGHREDGAQEMHAGRLHAFPGQAKAVSGAVLVDGQLAARGVAAEPTGGPR